MDMSLRNKIIAVDFDNTLTYLSEYPKTGKLNLSMIKKIKQLQKNNKIILWTCRIGNELKEAIMLCKDVGLEFDAINSSIDGKKYKKLKADIYIDDKAVYVKPKKEKEE